MNNQDTVQIAHDDPRLKEVGFAKLVGGDISYVMRKYDIILGRKSKQDNVDLVLGDLMSISRQHCKIYYNFETSMCFEFSPCRFLI